MSSISKGFDGSVQGQQVGASRVSSAKGSRTQSHKPRINSAQPPSQKNVASIPLSEIERIKEQIGQDGDYSTKTKQQERQEQYDKSQKRIENWPNTLNAMRKKKGDAKFERFQKDEEERRKIDEEEYKYQQQERQKIIEKANKQLYDQNDKVKTFQTKLLLVDALQERDEQIELKKQVKEIDVIREKIYLDQTLENQRKFDENEQRKREELQRKKEETAKVLKEQHGLMKQKYVAKYKENKMEGELIKERALLLLEKEKEEERRRRQLAIDNQMIVAKNNEYLAEQKKLLQAKLDQEDALIKKHAEKKEKVDEMRKIREQQIFKIKQDEKQRLIDAQTKQLQELKNKEDQILNKQIKEAEIKAEQVELIKKQKQEELKKRIDESIAQTLKKKRAQTAKDKLDDEQFQQYWKKKNEDLQRIEMKEKGEAHNRALELQNHHLRQAEHKQKLREQKFLKELEEEEQLKKLQENDGSNFKSWAERMITEWQKDGKNIQPLLQQLARMSKEV